MWVYNGIYDELYHHGIIGQRWGVRRYQNKDGSLTSLGKSRRKKSTSIKVSKKTKVTEDETPKEKSYKEMSDEELTSATTRMKAEYNYLTAKSSLDSVAPKKVSAGKKFVSTLTNKVIAPAATTAGKNLLQEWLEVEGRKALGLPAKSSDKKKKKKGKD